jgi:epoxyqueuosine reductase QueG
VNDAVDPAELKALGRDAGLDAVGITLAEPFLGTRRHLHERRAAGLHGGMSFT